MILLEFFTPLPLQKKKNRFFPCWVGFYLDIGHPALFT